MLRKLVAASGIGAASVVVVVVRIVTMMMMMLRRLRMNLLPWACCEEM